MESAKRNDSREGFMNIDIAIYSYDDIFSDFDIRKYSERQVSRDFIEELKIRMAKKSDKIRPSIILFIEKRQRNLKHEKSIISRLHSFFQERYEMYVEKRRKNILYSSITGLIGIFLLFAAQFLSSHVGSLFSDFLLIPSWFLVWNALEKMMGNNREIMLKIKHYRELSESVIVFKNWVENS
jgi:hypothetical protein